ncbi:protein kinase family protein [Nocardioides plantarum]|uniref:Protein kinase family protein n=1 Tax=Nocardioides plantarum TaxID=29299 RepID=A0ABV5KH26_9ACTN|nr:protein kinase family protein [Nocardioides plantarum]
MPHATRPGDLLGERYRLVDLLTESDGGRFWRAHDGVLERHVAIHAIRGDDARAPGLMEAARRSATVHDPRVLRVLDAEHTDEECYVVNEWGWGASLDIVVAGSGPLGARKAAWLVAEVADSVAVAHAAGVAHARLNPENVLVDRTGGIRIIGLGVDAALHGIDPAGPDAFERDIDDLAGLLYCALTARWAGPSDSLVPRAPHGGGTVLRPRQVRAGIPRPLDLVCDELLHTSPAGRHREPDAVDRSARGVADYLAAFVGDSTGMPEALLSSTPDVLPDEEQVVLPPVPVLLPHDADEPDEPAATAGDDDDTDDTGKLGRAVDLDAIEDPVVPGDEPVVADAPDGLGDPASVEEASVVDLPTEAGVPIFGEDDDVSWLERRATPAPPPPPFEAPPERPLFAPGPARTPRHPDGSRAAGRGNDEFWPWDTGAGPGTGGLPPRSFSGSGRSGGPGDDDSGEQAVVPGRTFLRLGVVIAVVVLVVVAVLVAVGIGRGGGDGEAAGDPTGSGRTSGTTASTTPAPSAQAAVLRGVTATAYDPQGDDGSENDDAAANAVDGDPETVWTTAGYNDQLGPPPGLKLGVGLLLDLGGVTSLDQVVVSFVGAPTSVSLYVTEERPASVLDLDPVTRGTADGGRLALDADGARGSYAVVWLTSLPAGDDGRFRGTVSEISVRGAAG